MNWTYDTSTMREIFQIAADVDDIILQKAMFEADTLDIAPQICPLSGVGELPEYYDTDGTSTVDSETKFIGAYTILAYYAFGRYLRFSTQASSTTGMVIPTFAQASVAIPVDDRNTRAEAERGKADIFIKSLIKVLKIDGILITPCGAGSKTRFNLLQ